MQVPLQITFRHMSPSPAVEGHIRERVAQLEKFFPGIVACRVSVESSARQHRQGKLYHLRVALTVPNREIVVKRDPSEHHAHEDILVAVRDAFDATRRQLEDHIRRQRLDTKSHATPDHGRIASVFPDHAFIRTPAGDEVYMHRNSLVGGKFEALTVGDEVRFFSHEAEGEKGPQASTVERIGKHHLPPAKE
ncbi:MAG TPA: HPF/RaiA family ribosome-associated protein [Stellaceae bacterium]|jgi:ribosome-associated translation inhibitor RaiA/cold shock CspA family protein|nr:HPF/RaiA family ribosome-associated protein [Stellaceae bacterium]